MSVFDKIEVSGRTKATDKQLEYIVNLYESLDDLESLRDFDESISLQEASKLIDKLKIRIDEDNQRDHELDGVVWKEF